MSLATSAGIIDWAADALSSELDSPTLRILAGLQSPPNDFEVDGLLVRACDELNLSLPTRDKAIELYSVSIARSVIACTLDPFVGCTALCQIYVKESYPSYLSVEWMKCCDALSLAESKTFGTKAEVEERIMEEAHRLLAGNSDSVC